MKRTLSDILCITSYYYWPNLSFIIRFYDSILFSRTSTPGVSTTQLAWSQQMAAFRRTYVSGVDRSCMPVDRNNLVCRWIEIQVTKIARSIDFPSDNFWERDLSPKLFSQPKFIFTLCNTLISPYAIGHYLATPTALQLLKQLGYIRKEFNPSPSPVDPSSLPPRHILTRTDHVP